MRSIAQSLYRKRRKVYPILPKSREDVHAALELDGSTIVESCYLFYGFDNEIRL